MNGTLRMGNKAILADVLTEGIECPQVISPEEPACLVIDGQALVVAVGKPENAVTFGDFANRYASAVLMAGSNYQRIDVVFDRYREETIKSSTRRRIIEGRDVPLPKSWANFLSFPDNKADIANFLSEELLLHAPEDKELVVAGGSTDELEVRSSKATTDLHELSASHEEADTRLVLHAIHCPFNTVVVSSRDIDVLLLLIYHFTSVQCQRLWIMTGTSKKRRYVPIHHVHKNLLTESVTSLLAYHAITGCDTTSYMANHTKRTAWKVYMSNHELLKNVGVGILTEEAIKLAEAFVCKIYQLQGTQSVDKGRHLLFAKTGKPEALPQTSNALRFHLYRVHYQTMVWRQANCPLPDLPSPTEMG